MKFIRVTIDKTGKPTVEADGFYGQGCKAATRPIEDALNPVNTGERTEKLEATMETDSSEQAFMGC